MLLTALRADARETLTSISQRTGIPVTTLFYQLGQLNTRFVTLPNWDVVGFHYRYAIYAKMSVEVRDWLSGLPAVNTLQRLRKNWYFVELIFGSITAYDDYAKVRDEKSFACYEEFQIVDDVAREAFKLVRSKDNK